jgi:signal transduction histidine kinase
MAKQSAFAQRMTTLFTRTNATYELQQKLWEMINTAQETTTEAIYDPKKKLTKKQEDTLFRVVQLMTKAKTELNKI